MKRVLDAHTVAPEISYSPRKKKVRHILNCPKIGVYFKLLFAVTEHHFGKKPPKNRISSSLTTTLAISSPAFPGMERERERNIRLMIPNINRRSRRQILSSLHNLNMNPRTQDHQDLETLRSSPLCQTLHAHQPQAQRSPKPIEGRQCQTPKSRGQARKVGGETTEVRWEGPREDVEEGYGCPVGHKDVFEEVGEEAHGGGEESHSFARVVGGVCELAAEEWKFFRFVKLAQALRECGTGSQRDGVTRRIVEDLGRCW